MGLTLPNRPPLPDHGLHRPLPLRGRSGLVEPEDSGTGHSSRAVPPGEEGKSESIQYPCRFHLRERHRSVSFGLVVCLIEVDSRQEQEPGVELGNNMISDHGALPE